MARWRCSVCGFIYDEKRGYPEGRIPEGTPFEELPPDWVCPYCSASRSFERVS
ncbi:MAG TPA: rubredoxin [Candidatus Korarchaeota archaeon]|nr:rubredoxin [Candidatus Korarchaeota archaeon]